SIATRGARKTAIRATPSAERSPTSCGRSRRPRERTRVPRATSSPGLPTWRPGGTASSESTVPGPSTPNSAGKTASAPGGRSARPEPAIDLRRKVLEDRGHGHESHLSQAADARLGERLVEGCEVGQLPARRTSREHAIEEVDRLLAPDAAGDALSARLVAEEADDVRGEVEDVPTLGHDEDRARAERAPCSAQPFPGERRVRL